MYTNDAGASTNLDSQTLPFTKKFTKKVAFAEIFTVSAYTDGPGTIKMEILVDGKVVQTASPVSNTYINYNISHQFQ
ncbi:hypothetical protein D3C71_1514050 [compost metagenome]